MSLSKGTGPFGEDRRGTGNYRIESPAHILHFEACAKRIRGFFHDEVVVDSTSAKLLHETGFLPVYYFPIKDVQPDLLEPSDRRTHCAFKGDASYRSVVVGDNRSRDAVWMYESPIPGAEFLSDHAAFYFDRLDAWFEEDEEIFVHPRDPYSRIDILTSSRHVRVCMDGQEIAATDRPMILFETSLPPRYYIPKQDVRMDLLEISGHVTECPYKGRPVHYSAPSLGEAGKNIAWSYEHPRLEADKITGLIAFYNERVDLDIADPKAQR